MARQAFHLTEEINQNSVIEEQPAEEFISSGPSLVLGRASGIGGKCLVHLKDPLFWCYVEPEQVYRISCESKDHHIVTRKGLAIFGVKGINSEVDFELAKSILEQHLAAIDKLF